MDVYGNNIETSWQIGINTIATFGYGLEEMSANMKDFTCLIVDDEILARNRIKKLLEDEEDVLLLEECADGESAIQKIRELKPDFVFLDIKMKDMTGFEVLANSKEEYIPVPIFVSAFDNYALQAFDYKAFDFLLKPFDRERFFASLERVKQYLRIKKFNQNLSGFETMMREISGKLDELRSKPLDKIPVKLGNKTIFIETSKIVFFSASGSYSEIHQDDKKLVLRDSLTNLYKILDQSKFIRIHRSTIINRDYIVEIQASSYYEIDIIMPRNKKFRVSKSYRNTVLQKLGL